MNGRATGKDDGSFPMTATTTTTMHDGGSWMIHNLESFQKRKKEEKKTEQKQRKTKRKERKTTKQTALSFSHPDWWVGGKWDVVDNI